MGCVVSAPLQEEGALATTLDLSPANDASVVKPPARGSYRTRSGKRSATASQHHTPTAARVTEGVLSELMRARRRSIRNADTSSSADAAAVTISLDLVTLSLNENPDISKPEQECIVQALHDNVLFSCMQQEQLELLARLMQIQTVSPGETVVTQGEIGDKFFVVRSGKFDVVNTQGEVINRLCTGTTFGELGLLYSAKRTANVVADAKTRGSLYALQGKFFRSVAAQHSIGTFHSSLEALKKVTLLQSLTDEQLHVVADAVQALQYHAGDVIVHKGEPGSVLYMIHSGSVVCTDIGTGASTVELHEGDYFGERALLASEPRAATVLAKTDVRLLALDQQTFCSLLGPLQDVLSATRLWRVVESVALLKGLPLAAKKKLIETATVVQFDSGQPIVTQGDAADAFYIIKEGEVRVIQQHQKQADSSPTNSDATPPPSVPIVPEERDRKRSQSWLRRSFTPRNSTSSSQPVAAASTADKSVEIGRLGAGDTFGEMALLQPSTVRAATVIAMTKVECFVVHAALFHELFADLLDQLTLQATHRQTVTQDRVFANQITIESLQKLSVLGIGSYGVVYVARHKPTGRVVAVKEMWKARLEHAKQGAHLRNEKQLLEKTVASPFLLKLYRTLHDARKIYFISEPLLGGELFNRLIDSNGKPQPLPERDARFYTACCVEALGYLHERNIVYRDLKPENVLLDTKGYAKLVDFGFAKKLAGKTYTLCGTPEYLAPEIIIGSGHSVCADSWALGVLLFELRMGDSPFASKDEDHLSICRNVLRENIKFPAECDPQWKALVQALLCKQPEKRATLVVGGDVRSHAWFSGFDWQALRTQTMEAPWVPQLDSDHDTACFEPVDEEDLEAADEWKTAVPTGNWDCF